VTLVAGQRYYIEALLKGGGTPNHMAVNWQIPGDPAPATGSPPISGLYLSPYNVAISLQAGLPADQSVLETRQATFSINVTAGSPLLNLQWYENGVPIPGANGLSYTTSRLTPLEDGYTYHAVVENYVNSALLSSVPSRMATLRVGADNAGPGLVSATRRALMLTTVTVAFDEELDALAVNAVGNYSINNGAIGVTSAVLGADGRTVVLTTSDPLLDGNSYTLTVNSITDFKGNPITANSQIGVTLLGAWTAVGSQNMLVIEAENYDNNVPQGSHYWEFSSAPVPGQGSFSGAGYMNALPELNASINEPAHLTDAPRLDYSVNFPVSGRYYVWLRGNDMDGNSVHVGIDNTDSVDPNDNRIGNNATTGWIVGVWRWTRDANTAGVVAWVDVPTPGLHTFSVWMREDRTLLDKILLTTDPGYLISPLEQPGPAEFPREGLPVITSTLAGPTLTVSWTGGGTLQEADEVSGPWSPVIGATNPHPVTPSQLKKFYRVAR